jgi:hypothetical protein
VSAFPPYVCRPCVLTLKNSSQITVAVTNGSLKRVPDDDVQSGVLELVGDNVAQNFITCPADPKKQLGIKLPFLVLIVKNVGSPCSGDRNSPGAICRAVA